MFPKAKAQTAFRTKLDRIIRRMATTSNLLTFSLKLETFGISV